MEKEHNLLESDVVTLTLDDDVEIECAIITTFNMDSTEYIALLPLDEDGGNEDGDVWIYRFIRDTTGGSDHDLQNIEDDDEYDRAADKYDEWLDTQEFEGFDIEELLLYSLTFHKTGRFDTVPVFLCNIGNTEIILRTG